jgi:monofunctional biosynthetic peptidoglycan transglycosylase
VKIFETEAGKPHHRLTPAPPLFMVALGDWQRYLCLSHRLQPINPGAESLKKIILQGKFARGASTITQQLAKNLFLSTDKSLRRKLEEYFIARRLEAELSKNRIFHLYLNVIEFGPGVFGVEAATRQYFGKSVGQLSLEEVVRLTAVIPKPLTESPTRNSRWLNWRAGWVLSTLWKTGHISAAQYNEVIGRFK